MANTMLRYRFTRSAMFALSGSDNAVGPWVISVHVSGDEPALRNRRGSFGCSRRRRTHRQRRDEDFAPHAAAGVEERSQRAVRIALWNDDERYPIEELHDLLNFGIRIGGPVVLHELVRQLEDGYRVDPLARMMRAHDENRRYLCRVGSGGDVKRYHLLAAMGLDPSPQ